MITSDYKNDKNMNNLEKELKKMDFNFFGTGQHIMQPDVFFTKDNNLFLDVRTPEEIANLKISLKDFCPVLEIPVNEIPDRINEIPKDKLIGVFCSGAVRASMIYIYLKGLGYPNVKILAGGYGPFIENLKPGKIYKRINNK